MPFRSTAQQRWAFGTDQPFADRWAKVTDFANLPKYVQRRRKRQTLKAEADTGLGHLTTGARPTVPKMAPSAPQSTPAPGGKGESLGPGITRIRGNLCNVHGKYGPCDAALAKKPKGGKGGKGGKGAGAKPKKTDEQRAQEREQRRQQRQAETTQQQAQNLTKIADQTDLGDHLANLNQFAQGKKLRPEDEQALVDRGLLERGADGTVRKTEQANVLLNAAKRGDVQGANDAISRASDAHKRTQDAAGKRAAAQMDREVRRQQVEQRRAAAAAAKKKPSAGGSKQPAAQAPGRSGTSSGGGASAPSGTASGGGGGSSVSAPEKAKPGQPEQAPAKNEPTIAPELQQAVDQLSNGGQVSLDDLRKLITNGLVKIDASGLPVLTAAGQRATKKEQTAQDRAMFAKMGGGGSGAGGGAGGGSRQSTLWPKGPSGKRTPQAAAAETRTHAGARQSALPGTGPEFHTGQRRPLEAEGKARPADAGKPAHGQTVGNATKAYGADPNTSYTMRHELVDMADIQASNTAGGGINPKYDPALQPRDRSRASSQAQIAQVAQNMNPEVLTTDFHRIDAGSPIIDKNGNVLSGNGRTLALQRAAEHHPDKFDAYKEQVKAQAREMGIDPAAVDKMQHPVLVRRLEGNTDPAAFAREANSSGTLRMSPLEQAKVDAGQISDRHMLKLHVTEGQDIDKALRDRANKPFIDEFLKDIPDNERANLLTRNGELNQMGLYRAKAAIYTRAFPGEAGQRMAESMLESLDPDVKTIQNGISGGLPAFSRATALTRSGMRDHSLDISDDLAKTVDVYARIKDNPSLTANTPSHQLVAKYLGQSSMFDRELNPEQERLLVHIDRISRKPTEVRGFLERYSQIVENAPQPGQASLFGAAGHLTRAELYDMLLGDTAAPEVQAQAGMF